ncbi:MAG: hypothetical protein WCW01_06275, partial [Gammaproteobacteria bacterium]
MFLYLYNKTLMFMCYHTIMWLSYAKNEQNGNKNMVTTDLSQSALLSKICDFIDLNRPSGQKLTQQHKEIFLTGSCFGFTFANEVFRILNLSEEWRTILTTIAQWNGERALLKTEVKKLSFSLSQIFDFTIAVIAPYQKMQDNVWDHSLTDLIELVKQQFLFFFPHLSESKKQPLSTTVNYKKSFINIPYFFQNTKLSELETLLKKIFTTENNEYCCLLEGNDHTISLSFRNKKWCLYDSNDQNPRATETTNFAEVLNKIQSSIGGLCQIDILTLHPCPACADLLSYLSELQNQLLHSAKDNPLTAKTFMLFLAKAKIGLEILARNQDFVNEITSDALCSPLPASDGPAAGKTPLLYLANTETGIEILRNNPALVEKITSDALCTPLPASAGSDAGITPLLCLAGAETGIEILKNNPALIAKITSKALCTPLPASAGSDAGITPLWLLASTETGREILKNNPALVAKITSDALCTP